MKSQKGVHLCDKSPDNTYRGDPFQFLARLTLKTVHKIVTLTATILQISPTIKDHKLFLMHNHE